MLVGRITVSFTLPAILRVMPDGMFLCELEDLADCGPIVDIGEKR